MAFPATSGDYNNVLIMTANTLQVTPDYLDAAVDQAVQHGKGALLQSVKRFFRLAEKDGEAPIDGRNPRIYEGAD